MLGHPVRGFMNELRNSLSQVSRNAEKHDGMHVAKT